VTRPTNTAPPRDTATPGLIAYPDPATTSREPIILSAATEFIGCLLRSTLTDARTALGLVADDDMPLPLERYALRLIRELVTRGVAPSAAAVLQHALTTADTTEQLHREELTGHVIDAMLGATAENLNWMAAAVLENAYRRAGVEYATRLRQAAEEASLDDYEHVLGDRDRLRDLWRRHRIAAGDTTVQEVGAA
jgi:hypothetical protein